MPRSSVAGHKGTEVSLVPVGEYRFGTTSVIGDTGALSLPRGDAKGSPQGSKEGCARPGLPVSQLFAVLV